MNNDAEFLKLLRTAFQTEARELVIAIGNGLVEMEHTPDHELPGILETVFRHAHSLKGAARAVNEYDIESVCQAMEGVFSHWKRGEITPSPRLFDALQRATGVLAHILDDVPDLASPPASVIVELNHFVHAATPATPPASKSVQPKNGGTAVSAPSARPAFSHAVVAVSDALNQATRPTPTDPQRLHSGDTIRVNAHKLDVLFRGTEELLSIKLTDSQQAVELEALHNQVTRWLRKADRFRSLPMALTSSSRPPSDSDALLLEFVAQTQILLASLSPRIESLHACVVSDSRRRAAQVDDLLQDVKKVLMTPFCTLLDRFPRLVRDLARDLGKEVELTVHGGEIEADRRILEELYDPLLHLVRNSVDHGVETPDVRLSVGKSACGTLELAVTQLDAGRVQMTVRDDGAGMDATKLAQKALQLGMVDRAQVDRLDSAEAKAFVFRSGFSTSPIVTDISGRGLGLAIVAERLEKLGGSVSLESNLGEGTSFILTMPVTLTTFHALRVRVGDQEYLIPTPHVEGALRLHPPDVVTMQGRPAMNWRGSSLPVVHLAQVLGLPIAPVAEGRDFRSALVIRAGETRVAFYVDWIVSDQEVLVKGLGSLLRRVRHLSGASILPNGQVLPILDPAGLVTSAIRLVSSNEGPPPSSEPLDVARQTILVAEDSITSRTLLRGILESAGYKVIIAVDGMDALTSIRTEMPDLVVSDVEMPRLNGLELTAKIRADERMADLPIVLVTALGSREDRERGIEVGANAYIIKSSFDQSNLLAVVRRLI